MDKSIIGMIVVALIATAGVGVYATTDIPTENITSGVNGTVNSNGTEIAPANITDTGGNGTDDGAVKESEGSTSEESSGSVNNAPSEKKVVKNESDGSPVPCNKITYDDGSILYEYTSSNVKDRKRSYE